MPCLLTDFNGNIAKPKSDCIQELQRRWMGVHFCETIAASFDYDRKPPATIRECCHYHSCMHKLSFSSATMQRTFHPHEYSTTGALGGNYSWEEVWQIECRRRQDGLEGHIKSADKFIPATHQTTSIPTAYSQCLLPVPNSRAHPQNIKLRLAWQWFCGNTSQKIQLPRIESLECTYII